MSDETVHIGKMLKTARCMLDTLWTEDYSLDFEWEDWLLGQYNETKTLDVKDDTALLENHCGGLIMVLANKYSITLEEAKVVTNEAIKSELVTLGLDELFDDSEE